MPVETQLRAFAGPARATVESVGAEALALPVRPSGSGGPPLLADLAAAAGFGELLPADPESLLVHLKVKGEPGEVVAVPVAFGAGLIDLIFYGVGGRVPNGLRRAGAAVVRRCRGREAIVIVPPEDAGAEGVTALAEGVLLAAYSFDRRSSEASALPPRSVTLATAETVDTAQTVDTADEEAVTRAQIVAEATALARDLANTPSAEKTPDWLAQRAMEIARGSAGESAGESGETSARSRLTVSVRDEHQLRDEGFGGLIAVGAGASRPPRLIELTYDPGTPGGEHIVLIGKGVTFDSGGLSLKPNDNMKLMKTDMAGGAVVLAVLGALGRLGVRHRVTGLVAAAENMPSGSAMRPSDVITHFGGRTSEVLNTDAEGRLVLADALAYADERLDPDTVVDVATLTGAAKVALGLRYGAMFATDDALAAELVAAGERSGERLWRMPLVDDYRAGLDSAVADLANIERGRNSAGSISAALFLREFAGGRRWAHLDIAGPARATADDGEISRGATGFGVRVLLRWLTS